MSRKPALTLIFLLSSVSAVTLMAAAQAADPDPVQDTVQAHKIVAVKEADLAPLPGAPVEEPPPRLAPEDDPRYLYQVPDGLDWLIAPPGMFLRADLGPSNIPKVHAVKPVKAWKPKKKQDVADVQHGLLRLKVGGIKAGSQNLSEAAHLQLALQKMSMDAKFSAEAGHKSNTSTSGQVGPSDMFQRDLAQIAMKMNPVPMAEVAITGAEMVVQTYRQPAQIGESGSAAHMIQTENRSAKLATVFTPAPGLAVTVGAGGDSQMTKDTTAPDREDKSSNLIATQNEEVFVSAKWTPVQGVELNGGTTTRSTSISWKATNSKSGDYRDAEPHAGVKLQLFDGTVIRGQVAYSSSGYDTDSFVSYARNATRTETVPVEPDHAWKIETSVERDIGPAKVALNYMEASDGTVTEFGFSDSGVQAPVSTTLAKRHEYGLDVSLPLKTLGVPHTTVSGHAVMRDSRVLDPVTGLYRRASGEVPASLTLKLEHTMPEDRLRFGLIDDLSASQTVYQTKQVSEIASTNKVGAYVAFQPGNNYELNLNVDGLVGTPSTERYTYVGSRAVVQVPASERLPGAGPTVRLSLVHHLN